MTKLPQFSTFDLENFISSLDIILSSNIDSIAQLVTQAHFTWENLIEPLELIDNSIEQFWSPLTHLHAVVNSPALRECYQACLPKLSTYYTTVGQNQSLYEAIKSIDTSSLTGVQQKIINDILQGFELSGVALSPEKKQRFEAIQNQLSELSNQFENNVLDAGQAFTLHITDNAKLQGMPDHAIQTARQLAEEKGMDGWLLNLEFPCYLAVATYADDRNLREKFYHAYITRASDEGPSKGLFDNGPLIEKMLKLKQEKAQLLGFNNYAELSLATKMAESPDTVLTFLEDLANRAYPQAQLDMNHLTQFAKDQGIETLQPWDIAYLSEKYRIQHYDLSQEELRPYFPQSQVLDGLFTIIEKLYGIKLQLMPEVDTWHSDVSCYQLIDEGNNIRGFVYIDLFARQQKRGGAWMDSLQSRKRLSETNIQLPIATLTCNFAKPAGKQEAIFSHDEVLTLFHEFGHCLHHLLTKVDYLSASGINGVEWDAVELPSQIFENWCWEKNALELLTRHQQTGQTLPDDLFKKLIAAKNFQSAMAMMRQLEFSLFDFRLHLEYMDGGIGRVHEILNEIRKKTTVTPIVAYNRFPHSFTHIFSGGYSAGYYSYKWAEVLSSDAYSRFEEEDIFNPQVGREFLQCILEVGSSIPAAEAFINFRKREATIDALLRHSGISNSRH